TTLPGRRDPDGPRAGRVPTAPPRPFPVLPPVGFALPLASPPARCALTAPFHPCRGQRNTPRRYVFCGTVPRFAPAGCYPAPLVRGARTFLSGNLSVPPERPSDRLTRIGLGMPGLAVKSRGRSVRHQVN